MGSEIAIIGSEVANILLDSGFELVSIKEGRHITVYYFKDCPRLEKYLVNMFLEEEKPLVK